MALRLIDVLPPAIRVEVSEVVDWQFGYDSFRDIFGDREIRLPGNPVWPDINFLRYMQKRIHDECFAVRDAFRRMGAHGVQDLGCAIRGCKRYVRVYELIVMTRKTVLGTYGLPDQPNLRYWVPVGGCRLDRTGKCRNDVLMSSGIDHPMSKCLDYVPSVLRMDVDRKIVKNYLYDIVCRSIALGDVIV